MSRMQNRVYSFLLSGLLHGIVFISLFFYWASRAVDSDSAEAIQAIQTYVYPQVVMDRSVESKHFVLQKIKKNSQLDVTQHEQSVQPFNTDKHNQETLLQLLHAEIQKQQNYPVTALQMRREGKVTVGFTLLTNGHITDIKLIKPCDTDSLNQAALQAIQSATPFRDIAQYIQASQALTLEIVFELPVDEL